MRLNDILIKPVLTEKATNLVAGSYYTFIVASKANKFQVKTAIEKIYPVKVSKVKIVIRKGKNKKVSRKMIEKKLPNIKIAHVKLKTGKIDLFPQS